MMAGMRGGVFPVRAGARRLAHDDDARFGRPTSTSGPLDKGEEIRRVIVEQLEEMGFEVEAAHHEVAHGQHEIDFKYADALVTADNIATFKFVVRNVANRYGYIASFMPKPIQGMNGSGMHTHQSLFRGKENAFFDPKAEYQLSKTALSYIEGLLQHARGFCAITNPLINSYKRLVPGYEAPVNVAWSMRNRSPLVRIPDRRGLGTRCELRMPDPGCNPVPRAGGAARGRASTASSASSRRASRCTGTSSRMSFRDRRKYRIDELPRDLHEALEMFEKDDVVKAALGEHLTERFLEAKRNEVLQYNLQVSQWEIETYLGRYWRAERERTSRRYGPGRHRHPERSEGHAHASDRAPRVPSLRSAIGRDTRQGPSLSLTVHGSTARPRPLRPPRYQLQRHPAERQWQLQLHRQPPGVVGHRDVHR